MEESPRKKFHFPGYDGALPKSTRTSRRRRAYERRAKHKSADMDCIDLLATVAGQVLQAKNLRGEIIEAQCVSANEASNLSSTVRSFFVDFPYNTSEHLAVQGKNIIEDIVRLEDSRDSINNIREVYDADPQNSTVNWADLSSNNWHLQKAENKLPSYPREVEVGECNGEDVSELNLAWKEDASIRIQSLGSPDPECICSSLRSEELNKPNANCGGFGGTNVNKGSSCMTLLPDDEPHPPSINSRKEAIIHVHKQLNRLCSEHPLESHLEFSQDLLRLNAKDDDDKVLSLVTPLRQETSLFEITKKQIGGLQNNKELSVTVAKRKGSGSDGMFDGESCLPCMRQFSSQQAKERKRKHFSQTRKVVVDRYIRPVDSDAKDDSVGSSPTTHKAPRRNVHRKSKEGEDSSPVRLNITSFRVPELSIDLPETATVASLKRAVMEAAVNLLGGGLHVRVLHHGNRIHDENSTLIQMGIACKDRMDSLAFMLEPNGVSTTSMDIGDSFVSYPKEKSVHAACYPVFTSGNNHEENGKQTENGSYNVDAGIDVSKITDEVELKQCAPCELPTPGTTTLVLHPHGEADMPVDIVASHQNHVSFSGKRRTRRPFSVLEVEALVQAVELLGTGRWREVKQQVFSNARHRTYVDLKDKWKTLVHTARIAPHQRRGEPVPQELLDRVLQAHTYWAMQLAKQQEDNGI